MKKVVFILAFAFVAAFSYASYSTIELNNEVIGVVEEEPKKAEKSEASEEKSETAKSDKKSECTKKSSSSCSKSCGSK